MTTFVDGPAQGQCLRLRVAPFFLRVTEEGGKWDALNEWEDTPRPGEKLHAYQLVEKPGMCHLYFGGGKGGWYAIAKYQFVADQPDDQTMRENARWAHWCSLRGNLPEWVKK